MSKTNGNRSSAKGSNAKSPQQKNSPVYLTRYVAIDSHLIERNGSTDQVFGIAGERPAGRKLAKDIANACNQLNSEGYEVFSIFPLVSGRVAEATVEAAEEVRGRTYSKREPSEPESDQSTIIYPFSAPQYEDKHYVDTGMGYSVTDGVVVIAKRRNA